LKIHPIPRIEFVVVLFENKVNMKKPMAIIIIVPTANIEKCGSI
jgi:hypothetical protein